MKESLVTAMWYVFSTLILLSALVYIVFYATEIIPAFDEIEKANETVFIKETEIPQKVAWSGAQVVGKLYRLSEENVTVTVDTIAFNNDEDVMNLASLINTRVNYEYSFTYGNGGQLDHIHFTTIHE